MALVHDNKIEKVRGELLVEAGAAFVLGDGLVCGEIKLAAVDHEAAFNLVPGIPKGGEGFVLGIVHQEIAVGQIQDARFSGRIALGVPFARPEFPADLKRHHGLAGAGGHGEQHALFAAQDGVHGAVNRDALVVVGNLAVGKIKRRQQAFDGVAGQLLRRHEPRPQFGRRGKRFNHPLDPGDEIELDDLPAVGGIDELDVENFPILPGLLQTIGSFFVFGLGLGDGDGKIPGVAEEVIGALGFAPLGFVAADDNPAIRERALLGDGMRFVVPARRLKFRHHELPACVRFVCHPIEA